MDYCYKEKKSRKIKIKIENNGEVVGFRTSYTKNMPNQWFMSIVLILFWFIFWENMKKCQKSFELFEKVQKSVL